MTLTTQFLTIISMICAGIYLGAAIDTFRRYERFWKRRFLFSYLIEICFWLLQTLILFYVLYLVNEGELRLYILLAIVCGYAAYKALFQSIYLQVLEWFVHTLISIYRFLSRVVQMFIINPIKMIIKFLAAVLLWLWGIVLWIVFIILKVIWYPVRFFLLFLWHLVPNKIKNYFSLLAGFSRKIKNTIISWYKFIKSKRG